MKTKPSAIVATNAERVVPEMSSADGKPQRIKFLGFNDAPSPKTAQRIEAYRAMGWHAEYEKVSVDDDCGGLKSVSFDELSSLPEPATDPWEESR